jgi:DNA-binding XRE family transcriptional regulator
LDKKLVKRLTLCRKNKGATQKEVAQAIRISERGYQRYEGGDHVPTLVITVALADYFDDRLITLWAEAMYWREDRNKPL